MENKKGLQKNGIGGMLLDIITIGMLFAAFGALFYSGFIVQSEEFPIGALCAITAVGLLLLFFIGDVSCLSSKAKKNSLTLGFLIFSVIQLVSIIVNLTLLLAIMVKLFSVQDSAARITYIVTTVIVLVGYVASISYFSEAAANGNTADEDESAEEDESADEDESAEEVSDGEESAEEVSDGEELVEEVSDEDVPVGEENSDEEDSVEEV